MPMGPATQRSSNQLKRIIHWGTDSGSRNVRTASSSSAEAVFISALAGIVEALQKFERDLSIGSLGLGSLHSRLEERIRALGDRPKTVYEFVFGLRGDGVAVAEEFRQLLQDDRADVPVLHVAIEQIAGFERSTSLEETVTACRRVESGNQLPPASPEWLQATLNRHIKRKRLVRVRDR